MFGGDPFNPFNTMQRQMQSMDSMMNAMMGDMLGGGMMRSNALMRHQNQSLMNLNPFNNMFQNMQNDPNSTFISESTMISFDGNGAPNVVKSSLRKTGDVQETRRTVQNGDRAKMTIGHTIGNRSHIIEKKRDKDGRVRQQQKFLNLEEEDAQQFNNEFKNRAQQNIRKLFYGDSGTGQAAIESGGNSSVSNNRHVNRAHSAHTGPIVTVPDDEDDEEVQYVEKHRNGGQSRRHINEYDDDEVQVVSSNSRHGPTIREISDDEEENPKRRKGLLGKFFRPNN